MALSRVWVGLFVYLAHSQRPFLGPVEGGWEGVSNWWLNPWTTYDSRYYISIAQHGYDSFVSTAFFPLYAIFLKPAGSSPNALAFWGIMVSTLALFGGLVGLYRLGAELFDERIARLSTFIVAFIPTAAFMSAVYTESLFFFWLVWAFYAAHRRQWLVAGLLGGLAGLTRNSGGLITAALLITYATSLPHWRQARLRDLLPLGLPLVAFLGVQLYLATAFASPMSSVESQSSFGRALTWPWLTLWREARDIVTLRGLDTATPFNTFLSTLIFIALPLTNFVMTLLAFGLMARYWRRLPLGYVFFTVALLFIHITLARVAPSYTLGAVRFLSTTFPFALALALAVRSIQSRVPRLLPLLLPLYLLVNAITSYLFAMKIFFG